MIVLNTSRLNEKKGIFVKKWLHNIPANYDHSASFDPSFFLTSKGKNDKILQSAYFLSHYPHIIVINEAIKVVLLESKRRFQETNCLTLSQNIPDLFFWVLEGSGGLRPPQENEGPPGIQMACG